MNFGDEPAQNETIAGCPSIFLHLQI